LFFAKCPPFEVAAVAAVVKIGTTPIKFKNASGDSVKNVTVMSDKDKAAPIAIETIFEPRDCIDVEVVRGLVENEQIAGSNQSTSKRDSLCLTTRKSTGVGLSE
jgi:hypothetical protein